jgi:hypothetical protein
VRPRSAGRARPVQRWNGFTKRHLKRPSTLGPTTNLGGYYVGLIRILDRHGLCAVYDGEDLAVKRTNGLSEHYARSGS